MFKDDCSSGAFKRSKSSYGIIEDVICFECKSDSSLCVSLALSSVMAFLAFLAFSD